MNTGFGTFYPDMGQSQFGISIAGMVFQIIVATLGRRNRARKLDIYLGAWEDWWCSEGFRNRLDFSDARLQMQLL